MVQNLERDGGGKSVTILDTHICIWFISGNRRIGPDSSRQIREARSDGEIAFSAISIWEIGMLLQKNRLASNMTADQWRQELLNSGFREIPVDGVIAARAGALEGIHGDPADRIIVATALAGHQLITDDGLILNWGGQLDRFPASR